MEGAFFIADCVETLQTHISWHEECEQVVE